MNTQLICYTRKRNFLLLMIFTFLGMNVNLFAKTESKIVMQEYVEYKGKVIDNQTKKPLIFASLTVNETNISTITNNEGEFALKIPKNLISGTVIVSSLGYKAKIINISQLKEKNTKIELERSVIELSEVDISIPKDAEELVRTALRKRKDNYFQDQTVMTAFYRESIKKRRKNVSLSEAVVNIYKEPYTSGKNDVVSLYKARKNTDYTKLDTVALKLQGGPFSTLYLDIMKYPEFVLEDDLISYYDFNFETTTKIDDRLVYIVNFKQKEEIITPLYYGKLYINANTLALSSAIFSLNVENKEEASKVFVKKKPGNISVQPVKATYRVDYREKEGKWYYGYSNVQLTFKINRKRKLFNSIYTLTSEMAVTDWEKNDSETPLRPKNKLKSSTIISNEATGFSDPEFWGTYNVIEPDKSIESAINKIKRQLKKVKS